MAEKDFNEFLEKQKQGKKENPITTNKKNKKEPKKQPQYKSIRIYPDDFVEFRKMAFEQNKHIVELVSESLELLKEQYKD
ncbi:hypothetical protein [Oceanobacillus sp. FSL K6-0251]|uniref:hypothetical protein n=1 Tax=Oceanobacillus sp. FSL K6-0251 TaxID=2921602 RepID=UPI0030FAAD1A